MTAKENKILDSIVNDFEKIKVTTLKKFDKTPFEFVEPGELLRFGIKLLKKINRLQGKG